MFRTIRSFFRKVPAQNPTTDSSSIILDNEFNRYLKEYRCSNKKEKLYSFRKIIDYYYNNFLNLDSEVIKFYTSDILQIAKVHLSENPEILISSLIKSTDSYSLNDLVVFNKIDSFYELTNDFFEIIQKNRDIEISLIKHLTFSYMPKESLTQIIRLIKSNCEKFQISFSFRIILDEYFVNYDRKINEHTRTNTINLFLVGLKEDIPIILISKEFPSREICFLYKACKFADSKTQDKIIEIAKSYSNNLSNVKLEHFQKYLLDENFPRKRSKLFTLLNFYAQYGLLTFEISNPNVFCLKSYNPHLLKNLEFIDDVNINHINEIKRVNDPEILNNIQQQYSSFNLDIKHLLEIKNKKLINYVKKEIQESHNLTIIDEVNILSFLPVDALIKLLQSNPHLFIKKRDDRNSRQRNWELLLFTSLQSFFSEEKRLNLFIKLYPQSNKYWLIRDTAYALDRIARYNENNPEAKLEIPQSPKDIKEFHDIVNKIATSINNVEYRLPHQDKLISLENINIRDSLKFKIPRTNYDLIHIGSTLNICVGNGIYAKNILNNDTLIISVFGGNVPLYCIEYDYYNNKIIQIKAEFNNPLNKKDELLILNLIKKWRDEQS